jgi:hypothetical protein
VWVVIVKLVLSLEGTNMKTPCKDCGYRTIGCHGKCESYKQYKKDMATLKAAGLLKSEPYIYIRSNVNKIRRKMGKPDYAV